MSQSLDELRRTHRALTQIMITGKQEILEAIADDFRLAEQALAKAVNAVFQEDNERITDLRTRLGEKNQELERQINAMNAGVGILTLISETTKLAISLALLGRPI